MTIAINYQMTINGMLIATYYSKTGQVIMGDYENTIVISSDINAALIQVFANHVEEGNVKEGFADWVKKVSIEVEVGV